MFRIRIVALDDSVLRRDLVGAGHGYGETSPVLVALGGSEGVVFFLFGTLAGAGGHVVVAAEGLVGLGRRGRERLTLCPPWGSLWSGSRRYGRGLAATIPR